MVQKIQNAKPKSKPDGDPQSYLPTDRFDAGALGRLSQSVSLDLVSPTAPAISPDLLSWPFILYLVLASQSPMSQTVFLSAPCPAPALGSPGWLDSPASPERESWTKDSSQSLEAQPSLVHFSLVPEPTVILADGKSESLACRSRVSSWLCSSGSHIPMAVGVSQRLTCSLNCSLLLPLPNWNDWAFA